MNHTLSKQHTQYASEQTLTERLSALLTTWGARAASAHPTDSMLINKHIRELQEACFGDRPAKEFSQTAQEIAATVGHQDWIAAVIRDVAELPDRNSPDDWPEAMLVTADELRGVLEARRAACSAARQDAKDAERFRKVLHIVGAMLSGGWRQVFHLERLKPLDGANLMKGSVAQHFEEAIDAMPDTPTAQRAGDL